MKAKKFEQQFDEGVDLTAALGLAEAKRVRQEQKRVNVGFPSRSQKPTKPGRTDQSPGGS